MRILAVDTSTSSGSIAMLDGSRVMVEVMLQSPRTHNRRLLKNIDCYLKELGWTFEQLDAFAVGIGPGSFTGLRIGVTTIKALAWAVGKPFAAIPSLDALAAVFGFAGVPICPLIDARKQEVYFALYQPDERGEVKLQGSYQVGTPQQVAAQIQGPTLFCGDGWSLCQPLFSAQFGEWVLEVPAPFHVLRASLIGELARKKLQKHQSDDPMVCIPHYVRPSEAELQYPHLASSS